MPTIENQARLDSGPRRLRLASLLKTAKNAGRLVIPVSPIGVGRFEDPDTPFWADTRTRQVVQKERFAKAGNLLEAYKSNFLYCLIQQLSELYRPSAGTLPFAEPAQYVYARPLSAKDLFYFGYVIEWKYSLLRPHVHLPMFDDSVRLAAQNGAN